MICADCDARLAALDTEATQAAVDGALGAARDVHAKSLELWRDLNPS